MSLKLIQPTRISTDRILFCDVVRNVCVIVVLPDGSGELLSNSVLKANRTESVITQQIESGSVTFRVPEDRDVLFIFDPRGPLSRKIILDVGSASVISAFTERGLFHDHQTFKFLSNFLSHDALGELYPHGVSDDSGGFTDASSDEPSGVMGKPARTRIDGGSP